MHIVIKDAYCYLFIMFYCRCILLFLQIAIDNITHSFFFLCVQQSKMRTLYDYLAEITPKTREWGSK
jgi:hypothetical protein